jgi:hypothetical protein
VWKNTGNSADAGRQKVAKLPVLRKDWPGWCKSEEENSKTNTMWYETENEVLKNTGNSAKAGR